MIVDSSALIAILREEAGFELLRRKLVFADEPVRLSSAGLLETAIVADGKRDPAASRRFDDLIVEFQIEVVPFTFEHAKLAREAGVKPQTLAHWLSGRHPRRLDHLKRVANTPQSNYWR